MSHAQVSRRTVLAGAAAATASLALSGRPAFAGSPTATWSKATLTGSATRTVVNSQFMPVSQLRTWQQNLDAVGLRATGSASHHRYIDGLASRMQQVGIKQVVAEGVPFMRWQPSTWSLDVVTGGRTEKVRVAWYVPYSGGTPTKGVSAPLSPTPRAGTIGIATVKPSSLPFGLFDVVDYDTPLGMRHPAGYNPAGTYQRAWMASHAAMEAMETHRAAGAVGLIIVLDLPREAADGQYLPYDGKVRGIPSLFVDREVGARLVTLAGQGATARLTLTATVTKVSTPNVYGVIPGASEEFVMVQSHTDGTNGLEENGPEGMLAMAQYLSRIPRKELPRTVMFLMSTGHMSGMAMGTEAFLRRHSSNIVRRTAAAMSVEHLGALAWQPDSSGKFVKQGPETHIVFSSPHVEMVKTARQIQNDIGSGTNWVLRPYVTDEEKISPNGRWWPGDGEGLWRISGLPSLQTIAGPSYLLNSNFKAMPFIDISLMRRQAIAFTNATLKLAATPWAELREARVEDPLWTPPIDLVNSLLL